ncbi:MAG TPA: ferredoxin reductase [Solirubrobacterales bacterium]
MDGLTEVSQRAPGRWQIADVEQIRVETPRTKTFRLRPPMWMPHLPGQHYDVRLTAPDGYRAERSYSIASSPLDEGAVELTVDRLDGGEVSSYFHDVLVEGDQVEVRGPFASYFVWRGEEPVLLIGGGSGVVPLMCMLRHRRRTAPDLPMRLLYSARTRREVIYADELGDDAIVALTRELEGVPIEGLNRVQLGRIFPGLITAEAFDSGLAFVCGSNSFVESMSQALLTAGYTPDRIRTERFGPTG